MKPKFVIISGLIGAGKSTFSEMLAEHLGYKMIAEPVETNPYLGDFYNDPKAWAYVMQEHLKSARFRQHMYAVWSIQAGVHNGVVMDRSIHEDSIFAEVNRDIGTIEQRKFETYLQGLADMTRFLAEPDVIVYLDVDVEVSAKRITMRDRPQERGKGLAENEGSEDIVPVDYLRRLKIGYEAWIDEVAPRMPVVRVDWNEFKPVGDVWAGVLEKIEERSRFTRSIVLPDTRGG